MKGVPVGFVHTSEVHVSTFRALLHEHVPGVNSVDVVDAGLLDHARRHGLDAEVRRRLKRHLCDLRDRGAQITVCTCSTLGGVAEELAADLAAPALRVDRPMAERAAAIGG